MNLSFPIRAIRNACLPMAILALMPFRAEAGLSLTAEAPGVQFTSTRGVTTETFDGFKQGVAEDPLVTNVGILSAGVAIVPANRYGGADGAGGYAAIRSASGATAMKTLTFYEPQTFFGFWWSASDSSNFVRFYNGTTLIASCNHANAIAPLSDPAYHGDPASGFRGQDPDEKFVYLNVHCTDGTEITSVVFGNDGTGGDFEVDNFSIMADLMIPYHDEAPRAAGAVPEPSSVVLTGAGMIAGAATILRSRRKGRRPA